MMSWTAVQFLTGLRWVLSFLIGCKKARNGCSQSDANFRFSQAFPALDTMAPIRCLFSYRFLFIVTFFPRTLNRLSLFPRLTLVHGYMFSRALHRFSLFPRLKPVHGCMFSRALHRLSVSCAWNWLMIAPTVWLHFPALCTGWFMIASFPRFATVVSFPALKTGTWLHLVPRFQPLGSMFSHSRHRFSVFPCLCLSIIRMLLLLCNSGLGICVYVSCVFHVH